MRFLGAIAWLAQIVMFLTLGLLVFPSRLSHVAGSSLLIAIVLIVLARPVAVFLSLGLAKVPSRERLFLSWVGLRGAVPIALATFPLLRGAPHADLTFDVVFCVVITSVGIQGTTTADTTTRELVVQPESFADNRTILDLGLRAGILIVLVNRPDAFTVAQGSTKLEAGDRVLIVSDATGAAEVNALFASPDGV